MELTLAFNQWVTNLSYQDALMTPIAYADNSLIIRLKNRGF